MKKRAFYNLLLLKAEEKDGKISMAQSEFS
jgi:hypothetical protein